MLLFTKFTLRGEGHCFFPPESKETEEAWFRPVWEEGRCGGVVGGTCRVAHRFHWELGRQQVNIYEVSPAEDFLSPISRCWIYLHIFFLDIYFKTAPGFISCGSMRTQRGSQQHLWSWREGMYRFFVKLTFLIPAIAIAQGKRFKKECIYLFIFERALPQSMAETSLWYSEQLKWALEKFVNYKEEARDTRLNWFEWFKRGAV